MPASAYTGAIPDSGFTVSQGDADIIGTITNGAPSGFFTCPASGSAANNCLDLNGNQPGAVTTASGFNLIAGTTYALSFSLAGSIPLGAPYTMQATIGDSAPFTFSVPAGNAFGTEVVDYTPTTTQANAHVSFASTTNIPGNSEYGPLIDNVSLATAPTVQVAAGTTLLYSQNLAQVTPGLNQTGAIAGTGLTVTQGDIDVFGAPPGKAGVYSCPPPLTSSQTCIDLNGDQPGQLTTDETFDLTAGNTYTVQFDLAGNIPTDGLSQYTIDASFGNSGLYAFSVTPDESFQTESFSYSPTTDEPGAQLVLTSAQTTADPHYGPIITNIVITDPPASDVPEPNAVLPLMTGLTALTVFVRRGRAAAAAE